MKALSILLISALSFFASTSPRSITEVTNFYFLEATCDKCDIEAEGISLNHYVITESIVEVNNELDIDGLTSSFKTQLTEKFSNGELLFKNVVVRTSKSKKKLTRLQNTYRERYLKKGYHVKLLRD